MYVGIECVEEICAEIEDWRGGGEGEVVSEIVSSRRVGSGGVG